MENGLLKSRKDRFNEAFKYLVYTNEVQMKKDLAVKMETAASYISQALNGSPVVLNSSFLRRFCAAFPQFNIKWLTDGVGEMLKDQTQHSKENVETNPERTAEAHIVEAYALLIRDVERHHKELIEEIAAIRELRGSLEQQREEIRTIRRMLSQILYSQESPTTLPIAAETTAQSPEAQTTPETK
jgi:transcriptional regulator with XRE-family HTH domain